MWGVTRTQMFTLFSSLLLHTFARCIRGGHLFRLFCVCEGLSSLSGVAVSRSFRE